MRTEHLEHIELGLFWKIRELQNKIIKAREDHKLSKCLECQKQKVRKDGN